MLRSLTFFGVAHPIKNKYFQGFLKGSIQITNVPDVGKEYVDVIQGREYFLSILLIQVKDIFEFFDCYFTYTKVNNDKASQSKTGNKITDHFEKYLTLCCSSEELCSELGKNPEKKLKIKIEGRKSETRKKMHARTFAGIHLEKAEDMEKITECYAFLHTHSADIVLTTKEKCNFVFSNVILPLLKPKSKHLKNNQEIENLSKQILQDAGLTHPFPDPYYLALLLFWPGLSTDVIHSDIRTYVNSIRNSSQKYLSILFRMRSTVANFYLAKGKGLNRLVPKLALVTHWLYSVKVKYLFLKFE